MARVVSSGFARRIVPVHTPFDGDLVFALSTADREEGMDPLQLTALGVAGRRALEAAIEQAVRPAPSTDL
jgi:D-aminopeptidase